MNARTAKKRGIADGDMIWIESPAGKVKQKVRTSSGNSSGLPANTGQFGQYAMPIAKDTHRATINTLVTVNDDWTDKLVGNQQSLGRQSQSI